MATGTRERILAIAQDLFGRQGYTGTSIADIARELGTTPAALYYHFASKADVLDALLAEPLAAYAKLADEARHDSLDVETLLSRFVDFTAEVRLLIPIVENDPAVRALVNERLDGKPDEMSAAVIAALAGPRPSRAATVAAHAAFAVVKAGTIAVLAEGPLRPADRRQLVAAAFAVLSARPRR